MASPAYEPKPTGVEISKETLHSLMAFHEADKRWCEKSQVLIDELNKTSAFFPGIPLRLRGSCKDGTALARWFKNKGDKLLEWDVMYEIGEIYCHCRGYVESDPLPSDCKEYVYLKTFSSKGNGGCILKPRDPFKNTLNGKNINGQYLSCPEVKKDFMNELQKYFDDSSFTNVLRQEFIEKFKGDTSVHVGNLHQDGVSITFDVNGAYKDDDGKKHACVFSCDNIASVFCSIHWPEVYKHWNDKVATHQLEAGNGIVTDDEAEDIQNGGCHIIPKENSLVHNGDLMWRWSMSNAEASIISHFSEQQKLAFLMVKSYYYKFLSKIGENRNDIPKKRLLTSFFVKNSMLNIFNQKCKPADRRKKDYIKDVPALARIIYHYMLERLENNYCKHFFLHDINVLRDLHPYVRREAISVMQQNEIVVQAIRNKKEYDDITSISLKFVDPFGPLDHVTDDLARHANEIYQSVKEAFNQAEKDKETLFSFAFEDGTVLEIYRDQFHIVNTDQSKYDKLIRKMNSLWKDTIKPLHIGNHSIPEIINSVTQQGQISPSESDDLVRNLLGPLKEASMVELNDGVQIFRNSNSDLLENPFFQARIPIPFGEIVDIRTPGIF
eukprot:TCONS_00063269-protein